MTLAARWTLLWLILVALVVGQHLTAQAPPAPSSRGDISLREYLESRVACERALADERRESASLALKLQATEYERRSEAVERDASRLKESQTNYAPRETFELFMKEASRRLDDITVRLAESDATNKAGRNLLSLFMGGLALLITVLTYIRRRPTPPPPPPEPGMKANGLR
ncbi:MAG: hypothetical protein M3547_01405 [Acidobacteriota bacterium]|nr:hypothetical protein [Acidobacteriota bacterium]